MRTSHLPHRWRTRILLAGTGFWGVMALGGGYGMAAAPDGSALRFDVQWLGDTPFESYRVPGLLLGATGVASTVSAGLLWRDAKGWRAGRPPARWHRLYFRTVAFAQCGWMAGEIVAMWSAVHRMDAPTARMFRSFWWGFGALSLVNLGLTEAHARRAQCAASG